METYDFTIHARQSKRYWLTTGVGSSVLGGVYAMTAASLAAVAASSRDPLAMFFLALIAVLAALYFELATISFFRAEKRAPLEVTDGSVTLALTTAFGDRVVTVPWGQVRAWAVRETPAESEHPPLLEFIDEADRRFRVSPWIYDWPRGKRDLLVRIILAFRKHAGERNRRSYPL